ncbi:MAG: hypothetical protein ACW97A_06365 [Candidatus Thorarchaeota archaeon]|jgi:hypothetical protein
MKIVGYFDGTDSILLTKLVAKGVGTIPIANDWDRHGKIASHLEPGDVDLIIGYLHKIVAPIRESKKTPTAPVAGGGGQYLGLRPFDLLYPAKAFDIPALVIVPADNLKAAKKVLGKAAEFVTIVTPEQLEERVWELLKS